jgi:cell division transport system ATP-binding protein
MISLNAITKVYDGSHQKVLDGVSLDLNRGEFLYIVGGTGAGKTSLLKVIATDDSPNLGTVSLFGYDLGRISPSTLRTIRQAIGYVPQNIRLIGDLTVFENVELAASLTRGRLPSRQLKEKVVEVLQQVELFHLKDKLASKISGGEAQRVAIARALVRSPELIVADEPTGAQDRDQTWSLMDLFVKANLRGTTVVVATHDREMVRRIKKKCAIIQQGKVNWDGVPCI